MWPEIIYHRNLIKQRMKLKSTGNCLHFQLQKDFTLICSRLNNISKFSDVTPEDFNNLTEAEKSFWYDYASGIPEKLKKTESLHPSLRGFLPDLHYNRQRDRISCSGWTLKDIAGNWLCRAFNRKAKQGQREISSSGADQPAEALIKDWNQFSLELNYLIPAQLKKTGYEIIRREEAVEINIPMIRKLARAIHSKYLHEIRSQHTQVRK